MLFAFSFIFCQLAGLIGMVFNNSSINNWYLTLNKPSFNPPNYVFGPVWFFIFTLMAVAFYLVLVKGKKNKYYKTALVVFVLQWLLNVLWSYFFFFLRSPFMALIEIIILWLIILLTMHNFYKISKETRWLLLPYILWVTFAAFLNLNIMALN